MNDKWNLLVALSLFVCGQVSADSLNVPRDPNYVQHMFVASVEELNELDLRSHVDQVDFTVSILKSEQQSLLDDDLVERYFDNENREIDPLQTQPKVPTPINKEKE